jgi:hypothetical protein
MSIRIVSQKATLCDIPWYDPAAQSGLAGPSCQGRIDQLVPSREGWERSFQRGSDKSPPMNWGADPACLLNTDVVLGRENLNYSVQALDIIAPT